MWAASKRNSHFSRRNLTSTANGWRVEGDFLEWDYRVTEACGAQVASIHKELLHWTDTYVIDVADPGSALCVLMLALASTRRSAPGTERRPRMNVKHAARKGGVLYRLRIWFWMREPTVSANWSRERMRAKFGHRRCGRRAGRRHSR